ncbi:hypothetical protein GALL_133280 [mine drainage metagenome]|uniref:Uncharacterized protein n=1 Tax=mine drainage metagenome TaxID=410659 RepID=A0A1J5S939_9ZZZZ
MSDLNRRQFLSYMAVLPFSTLLAINSQAATHNTKSGGLQGVIHELSGDVFINKHIANQSSIILPGDTLSVAYGGRLVFSMGEDTYLLQEGSSLEVVSHNNVAVSGLRLLTGGLLSVFGKRKTTTKIYTRTAVIGIRGTGVYLNSQPEKLYFCTCYGKTDLHLGHHTEHIESSHHHALDITGATENTMTMNATQVIGHTDDDLRLLEHYSGRKPPFDA